MKNDAFQNEDLELDDITLNIKQNKKIKSGSKGKRGEREIVNSLNERFKDLLSKHPTWGLFSRSVGSGNRWGQQVVLSKEATLTFTGDLTCPTNFKFVIESKNGYNDIDLVSCYDGSCKGLDGFIKQVTDDSERSERKPLLIWKKDRKKKIAFVRKTDLEGHPMPAIYFMYKDWVGLDLEYLLTFEDEYFFSLGSH